MAELEAALVELNEAVERGDVSQEELDADMDMEDDAEAEEHDSSDAFSMVDASKDSCRYTCSAHNAGSSGFYPVPNKKYKPTANGWYVISPFVVIIRVFADPSASSYNSSYSIA
jgi:hypothetical protein